jgi:hypothetical protein
MSDSRSRWVAAGKQWVARSTVGDGWKSLTAKHST